MECYFENTLKVVKSLACRKKVVCTLCVDDLIDIHTSQGGKCFISGLPYVLERGVDWQCSLKILDVAHGYCRDNVVFVVLELNGSIPWTPEKFQRLKSYLLSKQQYQYDLPEFPLDPPIKSKPFQTKEIDGVECFSCHWCERFLQADKFSKDPTYGCLECQEIFNNSPVGVLVERSKSMIYNAMKRKGDASICEIGYNDLVSQYLIQGGLCDITMIPMTFKRKGDWLLSVERIDENKGYIWGNVRLICREFNTAHRQWTPEKIEYMKSHLISAQE